MRERAQAPVISVIIPIYNEAEGISELYRRMTSVMGGIGDPYELILVNDGSRDASLERASALSAADPRVKVINFSRNFGHQAAITAGMDYSSGQAVVIIDADLQDPPELIPEMIAKWREGFDIVYAVRTSRRGESLFKKTTAMAYYRLIRRITNVDIPLDTGDFRLMSRAAVDALARIREKHRYVRGLVSWIGFRQIGVPFVRDERFAGETKYPLKKMLKFALDGITGFSFFPLQLASYLGFVTSAIAFVGIAIVIGLRLFSNVTITGWASLMVCSLLLGGIQLITLGIIGEYLGRIYDEVKQRPLYIVRDLLNLTPSATGTAPGSLALEGQR